MPSTRLVWFVPGPEPTWPAGDAMRGTARTLVIRTKQLDREAAFDLCRHLAPQSVTELVQAVCPVTTPSVKLFDALADAFAALQICNRSREAP